MARKRRRQSTHSKSDRNTRRVVIIVGFWAAVLALILLIDLKPWQGKKREVSQEWPRRDLTEGDFAVGFDGIDVSRHQGKIHWEDVPKNKSLRFVYIKATEGSSMVDPFYERNIAEARARGYLVGSYHFLTRRTSIAKQVDNFLKTIDESKQDLLPVVDIEQSGTRGWDRQMVQKKLQEFIDLLKKRIGKAPMIYTNEKYYHRNLYPEFNHYYLFIANYGTPPVIPNTRIAIWQATERGRVHGIWNWTDLDFLPQGQSIDELRW